MSLPTTNIMSDFSGFKGVANILTTFSPIIIAAIFTSFSFIFQNFKGLVYLVFLIFALILRNIIFYIVSDSTPDLANLISTNKCHSMSMTDNDTGAGFNIFIFAFTAGYAFLPMVINKTINIFILTAFILYAGFDMLWKNYNRCIFSIPIILVNLLFGLIIGITIVLALSGSGNSKLLFFNEYSSDKEICSMANKQQFKCAVYKNGQLIGSS
jgi:hypothetical protein